MRAGLSCYSAAVVRAALCPGRVCVCRSGIAKWPWFLSCFCENLAHKPARWRPFLACGGPVVGLHPLHPAPSGLMPPSPLDAHGLLHPLHPPTSGSEAAAGGARGEFRGSLGHRPQTPFGSALVQARGWKRAGAVHVCITWINSVKPASRRGRRAAEAGEPQRPASRRGRRAAQAGEPQRRRI